MQRGFRCPNASLLGAPGTPTSQTLPATRHPSVPKSPAMGWFGSRGLRQGQALHPRSSVPSQGSVCCGGLQPAGGCDGKRASARRRMSLSAPCAGGTPRDSSPQRRRSRPWDQPPHVPLAARRDPLAPLPSLGLGVLLPPWAQPATGRGQTGVTGPTLGGKLSPNSARTKPLHAQNEKEHCQSCSPSSAGCFPSIPNSSFSCVPINPSLQISLPRPVYLSVRPPLCMSLAPSPACIRIHLSHPASLGLARTSPSWEEAWGY